MAGSYQLSVLYILVYICRSQPRNSSHHHPLPPVSPLGVFKVVLYICVSISVLQTASSVPFFYIPHICVNIWYLFFSDLLHSVWQSLGPTTSLQMTQFCSFLWLSNIPFAYIPHLLYPFICWWTLKLLPYLGYCK